MRIFEKKDLFFYLIKTSIPGKIFLCYGDKKKREKLCLKNKSQLKLFLTLKNQK